MPTFDAASSGQSATSPLTIPHTVGAGDNPALVSAIFCDSATGIVDAVTAGGAPMVKHAEFPQVGPGFTLYLYKLAAPAQGAPIDIVIAATAPDFLMAINVSALDADQDDILGAAVTGASFSAGSFVEVIDGLRNDALLIDNHLAFSANDWTPFGVGQVERGEEIWMAAVHRQNVSTKPGTGGGFMSWSSAFAANWYTMAAAIKTVSLRPRQAITLKEV